MGRELSAISSKELNEQCQRFAKQMIEIHPRFRGCSKEVRETLAFRLYSLIKSHNYANDLGSMARFLENCPKWPDIIAKDLDLTPV